MYGLKLYQQKNLEEDEVEKLKILLTYPFLQDEGMLVYISRKKENAKFVAEAISRYFFVEKVVRNLGKGIFSDILNINTLFGNQSVLVNRSIFSTHRFEEMNSLGLVFNNWMVNTILKYINLSETIAPTVTEYCSVGWVANNNGLAFLGLEDDDGFEYVGEKDLSARGSFEEYRDTMNQIVIGRVGLEIALLTSLSSALVGLLSRYKPVESFLVHFFGTSSNGKTTALQLAASVWGQTIMGKGILSSWHGTDNAILSKLDTNFGIVQCLDESSAQNRNFSTFIYTISQNTGKSRLNKAAQLQAEKKFCTSILSSGEHSLLAASNENIGLRVRILEFFNVPLTEDAQHSNKIKSFTATHYGTLGRSFVNALVGSDIDSIISTYDSWQEAMIKKIKIKLPISERLAERYALLLTTANIARQFLGLNFCEENIEDFLLQHHQELASEANMGLTAYYCILDWIVRNDGKLLSETSPKALPQRIPLIIEGKFLGGNNVALLCSTFEKILSDNHFTDARVVANELKEMGILKPESKDKLKARIVINGVKVPCYRLIIKEIIAIQPIEYSNAVTDEDLAV